MHRDRKSLDILIWLVTAIIVQLIGSGAYAEKYSENIELVQHGDGTIYTVLKFAIAVDGESLKNAEEGHYGIYPSGLGEISNETNFEKLHLSITYGYWELEKWGSSEHSAPEGMEIWSVFPKQVTLNTKTSSDKLNEYDPYTVLLHGLSSIIAPGIGETKVQLPWSQRFSEWHVSLPENIEKDDFNEKDTITRHIHIPRYTLCKENIISFLRLLPCNNNRGIASLITPSEIFRTARYISIGIDMEKYHTKGRSDEKNLYISMSLALVFDTVNFQLESNVLTLNDIFSTKIVSKCGPSDYSAIRIYGSNDDIHTGILAPHGALERHLSGRSYKTLSLDNIIDRFDSFGLELLDSSHQNKLPPLYTSDIHGDRYITGILGKNSAIVIKLRNTNPISPKLTTYLHTFPWFIKPFLHTLKVIPFSENPLPPENNILLSVRYTPAKNETSKNVLELDIKLPSNSTVRLELKYTFILRKHSQYSVDIERLVNVGQGVLTVYDSESKRGATQLNRIFLNPISVRLPVTDFSMPFNVALAVSICYTTLFCSIIGIHIRSYKISRSRI